PLLVRDGRPGPVLSQSDHSRRHARLDLVRCADGEGSGRQGLSLPVSVRSQRQARRSPDGGADAAVGAGMAVEGGSDSVRLAYLAPLAGRGRIASTDAIRVRGTLRESNFH